MIPQCYATGQAAGTAAALAVQAGCRPRALDVGRLRTTIQAAGGIC
ncbi:MAG: FAD-dependent oxidoreductase [Armatimonadetes bacterium]|nr:FAD-dependent oxidoreductase [Armatimonadota bacterium]